MTVDGSAIVRDHAELERLLAELRNDLDLEPGASAFASAFTRHACLLMPDDDAHLEVSAVVDWIVRADRRAHRLAVLRELETAVTDHIEVAEASLFTKT